MNNLSICYEEYLLLKELENNPKAPIKDNPYCKSLRRKGIIAPEYILSDDGIHTIEIFVINPDKKYIYEEYAQMLKTDDRAEIHSATEQKSYRLDLYSLIISAISLIIAIISLIRTL